MKNKILYALALSLALAGCATETDDPSKLELESPGDITLTVGDTTGLWVVSKTAPDANGRTLKTKPYTSFTLVSSDPEVAVVVQLQRIKGLKAGKAAITATDDRSSLATESADTVTVVEP